MMQEQIEELKRLAEANYGWRSADSAWLHASDDGSAVVGNIDDEHDPQILNPVAVVDVAQYDGFEGDSIQLAKFYAAANPAAILELIAERNELLAALKDAGFILDMIRTNKDGQAQLYVKSCAGNMIKVQDVVEAARSVVAKAEG